MAEPLLTENNRMPAVFFALSSGIFWLLFYRHLGLGSEPVEMAMGSVGLLFAIVFGLWIGATGYWIFIDPSDQIHEDRP